jgi:S-adenosyl methyltransferase
MSAPPPGSYLAVSHLASDVAGDALTKTFAQLNSQMAESVVLRTRGEVAGLFGRLEMVEPGVVQLPQWHPDSGAPASGPLPMWCGVGRKAADQLSRP